MFSEVVLRREKSEDPNSFMEELLHSTVFVEHIIFNAYYRFFNFSLKPVPTH